MNPQKRSKQKGLGTLVYDFFCSVKLSIVVLIALALTSIFGTVIQQGKGSSVYVQEYGELAARIIGLLGLDDMYHSWWFQVLLGLLLANITFCSIKRLPHAIRLMRDRDPLFDGRPVAIHERWEARVKGMSRSQAADAMEKLLSERVGSPVRQDVDGKTYFLVSRGGWARMGVYVTHLSLFLFAIGAIIGGQFGFKGFVNIPEGETVGAVALRGGGSLDLGFQLRLDEFKLEFYNDASGRSTGRPKDYISKLAVIENGQEVLRKTIEVNDPLIHQGIYFYQSSYGQAGGKGATFTVYGPNNNLVVHRQRVARGGRIDLGGGGWLTLRQVAGDFRGMGPAVEVVLERMGQQGASTVVFENPQANQRKLGEFLVRLEAVETSMYTGLQVAKDPGVPVVWAGCILITLGCVVAFFFSHRRVWGRVSEEEKGVEIFLGGNASRNRVSFEHWFGDLCEVAQETFEK